MRPPFITHIPKTACTSAKRSIINNRYAECRRNRYSGSKNALFYDGPRFVVLDGHYPYGVHRLYGVHHPRYLVMLREPVSRAISYYYFVKYSNSSSYTHPSAKDVSQNDLVSFYQNPKFQNVQTRFVSGWWWNVVGRYISLNNWFGELVLTVAKRNLLMSYDAFGLQSEFNTSVELFANRIGSSVCLPDRRYQSTPNRPSKDELSNDTIKALRRLNSKDMQLHQYAVKHFYDQL